MDTSFKQPDQLRRRLAEIEAQISTEEAKALPLSNRLHTANATIERADTVLRTPYSYPEHRNAQEAKSAAYFERADVAKQQQDNSRYIDTLKSRLGELRRNLHRAEYEAVSTNELSALLSQHVIDIQSIDRERDDLGLERDTLQRKHREAQQATAAVEAAKREQKEAQAVHDQSQADAFISGESVDLSAHVARIGKAEKGLIAAEKAAAAGRAALPRISARLAAIEDKRAELEQRRRDLLANYWNTRKRIVEIEYSAQLEQVIKAGRRFAALHGKTGGHFGHDLIAGLQGLKRPVLGQHFEDVGTVDSNFDSVLVDFETELSAALSQI